jgi:hypothetical protein
MKKLDQMAQHRKFHNALNAIGQIGTTWIQNSPNKNPDIQKS